VEKQTAAFKHKKKRGKPEKNPRTYSFLEDERFTLKYKTNGPFKEPEVSFSQKKGEKKKKKKKYREMRA